jgi:hypothetical protein
MNTALLSLDRAASFGFARSHATARRAAPGRSVEGIVFNQLAAFCTRVLLLGGRSPLEQPMLSRILLAAYAGGALDSLADEHGLDLHARLELLTRLLREVLTMSVPEAQHHAAAIVSPAAPASPRLHGIMLRGADAFAQWQAEPGEFVPDDFRALVADCAARRFPAETINPNPPTNMKTSTSNLTVLETRRRALPSVLLGLLCFAFTLAPAFAQVKLPINRVPFVITKPGVYFLAKNLTITQPAPGGVTDGIRINASNVTLDLNGRTLASTLGSGSGIITDGTFSDLRISNGTIRGFQEGLYLVGNGRFDVADVAVLESKSYGIYLQSHLSSVRRCRVIGMSAPDGAGAIYGINSNVGPVTIEDCTVSGLSASAGTTITGIGVIDSANRLARNTVIGPGAGFAGGIGIDAKNGVNRLTENSVLGWLVGYDLGASTYRGNDVAFCTVNYKNGVNGGGNQ